MLPLAVAAFTSIAWLATMSAEAQQRERTAVLAYDDRSSSEECPDATALRAAVATRLGYDPFRAEARLALSVSIDRHGPRLVARVEVSGGDLNGVREFSGLRDGCAELAAAIVLALAIAIVPPSDAAALAEPTVELIIERDPEPARWGAPVGAAPAPRRPPAEESSMRATLWIGAGLSLAQLPAAAFGVRAGMELMWRLVSLALGGRAFLPASIAVGGGSVEAAMYAGEGAVCLRFGELAGVCALAVAGALVGSASNLVDNRDAAGFALSVGARGTGTLSLDESPFSLRIELDVLVPVVRWGLAVGAAEVWTAPPIGINAALFAGVEFL